MKHYMRGLTGAVTTVCCFALLAGCGGQKEAAPEIQPEPSPAPVVEQTEEPVSDPWKESAADGVIDFAAQYEIRPDIIGWLYVPGTAIDCPVYPADAGEGAYLTGVTAPEMIDFNSTMTAPAAKEGDPFATLYEFADPAFFETNGKILYFQPYGTMTYAVLAAGETDNRDLSISLTEGTEEDKQAFLDDLKKQEMGKNLQSEVLAGLTTQNFFLTLTARTQEDSQRQFIVTGMLAGVE